MIDRRVVHLTRKRVAIPFIVLMTIVQVSSQLQLHEFRLRLGSLLGGRILELVELRRSGNANAINRRAMENEKREGEKARVEPPFSPPF
jgi:hypothetical protein